MGLRNSSLTRVVPVFDRLHAESGNGETWLPRLLALPSGGHPSRLAPDTDYTIEDFGWGNREKKRRKQRDDGAMVARHGVGYLVCYRMCRHGCGGRQ